jgi:hypothetical protein
MARSPSSRVGRVVAAGSLVPAAALTAGCSLIFHVDASQCTTKADCTARGASFADSVCIAGTCVPAEGGAPEGGTSEGGTTVVDAAVDGGVEAGPACSTTADCPIDTSAAHQEVACDPGTHSCVQLTTDECPLQPLGDYKYASQVPPIFIGVFATIPQNSPTSDPSYLNYNFAIQELSSTGGIPAGPNYALRMPVAIVCNNEPSAVDNAMTHLANDLHVASVVTSFDDTTLASAFGTYGYNTTSNLFMINVFGADSTLTALPRGQQFWHMLGQPGDVATAYQALLPRIESYMRGSVPWKESLSGGAPLKVATVTGNATVLNDLASAVTSAITWNNGQTVQENGANYDHETLSGSVLNGDTIQSMQTSINTAVSDLVAFQPDVVISFASDEFITVLEQLELSWSAGPPPFYVISPYNAKMPSDLLSSWIGVGTAANAGNQRRIAGINVASSTDTSVLDVYDTNFVSIGKNSTTSLGEENYYDAVYFAVDSLVGAGGPPAPLTGTTVASGMLRLVAASGTSYAMGTSDMGNVFSTLTQSTASTVYLDGTLGPPIFNGYGARVTQGDVYCATINQATADGGTASTVFTYDAMRLVVATDGGAPALSGTPCFTGL